MYLEFDNDPCYVVQLMTITLQQTNGIGVFTSGRKNHERFLLAIVSQLLAL